MLNRTKSQLLKTSVEQLFLKLQTSKATIWFPKLVLKSMKRLQTLANKKSIIKRL